MLIKMKTKATSLFDSSPEVHDTTHEMADKLCITTHNQRLIKASSA